MPETDTYSNISIAYTVPATANEDFTVATPKTGLSSGDVDFSFNHMLSKVTVSAAMDASFTGYTVTFAHAIFFASKTSGTVNVTAAVPELASTSGSPTLYTGAKTYLIIPQDLTGCWVTIRDVVILKDGQPFWKGQLDGYRFAASDITGGKFVAGTPGDVPGNDPTNPTTPPGGGDGIFGDSNKITFSATPVPWTSGSDVPVVNP